MWAALEEYGLSEKKEQVKDWYDGFTFGRKTDIYNPWSVLNYLDKHTFAPYWANTSSNSLVGKLLREGRPDIKMVMEELLKAAPIIRAWTSRSFSASWDERRARYGVFFWPADICGWNIFL